MQLGKCPLKFH